MAVHTITGGHDAEQRRDGDYLDHDERYARTDEYLDDPPPRVDVAGAVRLRGPALPLRGLRARRAAVRRPRIPLFFGGSSEAAYRVGGKHADTFMLWGEPLAETAEQIASVAGRRRGRRAGRRRGSACRSARSSRRPRSSPGSGRTGSSTRSRAGRQAVRPAGAKRTPGGARRTRARSGCSPAAEKGDLHDRALWTPTARPPAPAATRPRSSASPETVAAAILDYVDIGVDTVLIRGYDPLDDAIDYGRYVIPLVRQELAGRGALTGPCRDTR